MFISLLFFLCSCSTSLKRKLYNDNLACLNEQQSVTAFLGNNEIRIRDQYGKRNEYLYASWKDLSCEDNKYYHGISEIAFSNKPFKPSDNLSQIPVTESDKWEEILEKVKYALAPENKGQGVSVVFNYQELVLYRDSDDRIYLKKFRDIPSYIDVTGLLKEDRVAAEIIKLLEKEAAPGNINHARVLYRTGNNYHGSVVFVFIDVKKRQSVFLTTPYHPEYQYDEGITPVIYMTRWFYRSAIIACLKNPFTTVYRLYCRVRHSLAVIFTESEHLHSTPVLNSQGTGGMDLAKWENRLDKMFPANRPYKGNVKFLIDGDNFFPRLIQCLKEAKKTIWFRTYIFDNDDYAIKVADILKRKSQDIKVRVLADHMGCMSAAMSLPSSLIPPDFKFPPDIFDYLADGSKIKVRATTNPWFTADHTKSIIIDNSIAFIGGMNIGREYRYEWHDMMMEVEGPIVGRLKKDFRRAWSLAGPLGDIAYLISVASTTNYKSDDELTDLYNIRPLYTNSGNTQILEAQLAAIRNAKKYIYIQNPYFSENTILNELILARGRGVDVRVILPSTSDYGFMDSSNIVTTNIMLKNGIRVYQYPRISHIKAAIYDGWACLGTANFDALSLRINLETDLAFSNPEAVERLKKELFEKDFSFSREIKAPVKVSFMDYLGEIISNQL